MLPSPAQLPVRIDAMGGENPLFSPRSAGIVCGPRLSATVYP